MMLTIDLAQVSTSWCITKPINLNIDLHKPTEINPLFIMNFETNRAVLRQLSEDYNLCSSDRQRFILASVHYIHRIVDAMLTESVDSLPTYYDISR